MDTPLRRVVGAAIVAVAIALFVLAGSFFAAGTADPPAATVAPRAVPVVAPRTVPVVRLRRGAPPVRSREGLDAAGSRARATADPAAPAGARLLTLEDLDPTSRDALGRTAMDRLRALVADCESTVTAPQDLGAFITLDRRGVVEVALRPIATDPGPIAVQDGELPAALVDCLDDSLWDQDWSAAAATVPEGAELPIALTLRLGPNVGSR